MSRWLIFERNDCAAIAAESGHPLEAAIRPGNNHYRAVAVDSVTSGGQIPASRVRMLTELSRRLARRGWSEVGERQT